MVERLTVFPFRPGDWVSDASDRVAKVKSVWEGAPGEVLLDLWIYTHRGERVGRQSPACGGPRTFEPACSAERWERIAEPSFPIRLQWVDNGNGGVVARMWAGKRLPPATWSPPKRKARPGKFVDDRLRRALERIADGDNDARAVAERALGRRP